MKIDRLIGILSVLLQREKVTAPYLAEQFEVSRRTISRDIETLCRAGIPIVTTQGAGGGISIMDGYRVDRTLLTSGEMGAILAGLRSLDSVSGTNRYTRLMEKLSAGSAPVLPGDSHILINLAAWDRGALSEKIERIHGAIERRKRLRFHYSAPKGESVRQVEPYYLLFQWSSWYLWAWCEIRESFRLFKLGRMTQLAVGEDYAPRPVPLPDLSNEKVFPRRYLMKAVIPARHRWRLLEEFGPDSFTVRPDGTLLFSFGFADRASILRYILTFAGEAELLEPADLRGELVKLAERIRENHSEHDRELSGSL